MSDAPIPLNAARAEREDDNSLMTPIDALQSAIAQIKSGDIKCEKILIMTLHEDEETRDYDPGYIGANISSSEMLALIETVKIGILKNMCLVE